jgi:hypothetical protein
MINGKLVNFNAQIGDKDDKQTVWIPPQSVDYGVYQEGCREGVAGAIQCPINGKLINHA